MPAPNIRSSSVEYHTDRVVNDTEAIFSGILNGSHRTEDGKNTSVHRILLVKYQPVLCKVRPVSTKEPTLHNALNPASTGTAP